MREIEYVPAILSFLTEIGLPATEGAVPEDAFLPGVLIRDGGLLVDTRTCLCAGDILHEAGHLAVLPPAIRSRINHDVDASLAALRKDHPGSHEDPTWICAWTGGDTSAIAWSYAAAVAVGMPTEAIFIQEGYQSALGINPMMLHDQIAQGLFPGIQLLARAGLTASPLAAPGPHTFPAMRQWMVA